MRAGERGAAPEDEGERRGINGRQSGYGANDVEIFFNRCRSDQAKEIGNRPELSGRSWFNRQLQGLVRSLRLKRLPRSPPVVSLVCPLRSTPSLM